MMLLIEFIGEDGKFIKRSLSTFSFNYDISLTMELEILKLS
ncbi:MAG: hypothetical protein JWM28_1013, partial [Chitinophagaceae bacterium]|nr:hypothetical protein [Chitinophagaceae bacterium]